MHQDGSLKLLIDRRVITDDDGGVAGETLVSHEKPVENTPLTFNY